jgi:ribosomal protein S18 acetylase RimI-like enzyme
MSVSGYPASLQVDVATSDHLAEVRQVYEHARAIQRQQGSTVWPEFSDAAILAEISAHHLFRVVDGNTVVGIFSVAYEDEAIWGEFERGAHIYLHRIARAPGSRDTRLVDAVLAWAHAECRARGRAGLRMDTWSNNATLIAYYQRLGFDVVGQRRIEVDDRLPEHYHGIEFALLEKPVTSEDGR